MSASRLLRSGRVARKQKIWIFFERHGPDGRVCGIRVGQQWHRVRRVRIVNGPMSSVYRGPHAPQPKFYLTGRGYLSIRGTTGVVTCA